MRRSLAALVLPALLFATACGSDDAASGIPNGSTTDTISTTDANGSSPSAPSDTSTGPWMDPNAYADAASGSADTASPSPADAYSADTLPPPDVVLATDTAPAPVEPEPPIATNPFVVAAHDPLSTFGADVDTASYEIFKRDLQQFNRLPVPATVRLEEFVNYFRYHDTPPAWDAEHPFNVALEAAPSPFTDTTLLRVGLQGKVVPPELKPPANLVFLVDVSGSMASSTKLPLVKVLLHETLDILSDTDTVSIVVYASTERVVLPPTPIAERALIAAKIDALEASGSTAGERGLTLAYEMAEQGWIAGGINHILLCTDGDFNVGISSTDALVDFISAKRQTGVTLTVVGFGSDNLNDAMMEAVSNAGDGVYAFIGDADSAVAYAHHRMLGSLYFIAKDLKIQVAFNPAQVYAYRLLGYENNAIADVEFTNDAVDAGEIGAGHAVTALYELVLAGDPLPEADGAPSAEDGPAYVGDDLPAFAPEDVVEVRVRYKLPGATAADPAIPVSFLLADHRLLAEADLASDDLLWGAAVAAFAELLKGSPYADLDNLGLIAPIVAAQAEDDADRGEFAVLFALARSLLEAPAAP